MIVGAYATPKPDSKEMGFLFLTGIKYRFKLVLYDREQRDSFIKVNSRPSNLSCFSAVEGSWLRSVSENEGSLLVQWSI